MADAPKNTKLANRKKSGLKAVRVSARRRVMNLRRMKAVKDVVKEIRKMTSGTGETAALLSRAYQAIDKAVKTGIFKKNTAARMKSGLSKKFK